MEGAFQQGCHLIQTMNQFSSKKISINMDFIVPREIFVLTLTFAAVTSMDINSFHRAYNVHSELSAPQFCCELCQ